MHCGNWHNECFFVNQILTDINLKVHCVANQIVLFVLLNKIQYTDINLKSATKRWRTCLYVQKSLHNLRFWIIWKDICCINIFILNSKFQKKILSFWTCQEMLLKILTQLLCSSYFPSYKSFFDHFHCI